MNRHVIFAAAVAAAACAGSDDDSKGAVPDERVEVGAPAPAYRAVSLAGDSVSLQALRGKVVLLNVWATWCHPCRDEIPELQSLSEKHRARGLEIVGVSVDANGADEAIRFFVKEFGMTYQVWLDPDERVSARFLVVGVPATFLIDREGIMRWRTTGPIRPKDPALATALEKALGV